MKTKLLPLVGVIVGILFGALLITITGIGNNQVGFLTLFEGIFKGTVGDVFNMGEWLMRSSLLILTGLSVAFAYRAGIFNIGAEGQFIVGSMVAAIAGIYLDLPSGLHMLVALSLGTLAGALYAMIPGILKAYFGVNEVVVTIMLNWIAFYYTNYLIANIFNGETTVKTAPISDTASLSAPKLVALFDGAKMHYGFIFVVIALFLYWFLLEKTRYGYELKVVGYNPIVGRYAGIKEKKAIISTLMISGAFAALAGSIYALGSVDALATAAGFRNYGFDGITVAFLGQMSAIGITLASLLIAGLRGAGNVMISVPKEIIDIVISIILTFSVLIPLIIRKYNKEND